MRRACFRTAESRGRTRRSSQHSARVISVASDIHIGNLPIRRCVRADKQSALFRSGRAHYARLRDGRLDYNEREDRGVGGYARNSVAAVRISVDGKPDQDRRYQCYLLSESCLLKSLQIARSWI